MNATWTVYWKSTENEWVLNKICDTLHDAIAQYAKLKARGFTSKVLQNGPDLESQS